ncbi:MAG: porin [Alphaproteobacteria bacterium]
MKKNLLASTAILLFTSFSALADGPTASLTGLFETEFGARDQKKAYNTINLSPNQKNMTTHTGANISAKVSGKADAGFTYGAVTTLQTTTEYTGTSAQRSYIFLESDLGRVEFGSNLSAARQMRVSAGTIARGSGGVDGNFGFYANLNMDGLLFKTNLNNYMDSISSGYSEDTRKITYFTPKIAGLQAGLSYTPDTTVNGTGIEYNALGDFGRHIKDNISLGLKYDNNFNDLNIILSATGEFGKTAYNFSSPAIDKGKHNLTSWMFGAQAAHSGFSIAGSYGNISKKIFRYGYVNENSSIQTPLSKDMKTWTAGIAYSKDDLGVSITYLGSEVPLYNYGKNSFDNLALSVDYKIAPGILPYVEVLTFKQKAAKNLNRPTNKGNIFMLGSQFTF